MLNNVFKLQDTKHQPSQQVCIRQFSIKFKFHNQYNLVKI